MLDADTLKAMKVKRQRGVSTHNQSHDRRAKTREIWSAMSIMLLKGHDDKVKVTAELRLSFHFEFRKQAQEVQSHGRTEDTKK